jgi:hypothetical protein
VDVTVGFCDKKKGSYQHRVYCQSLWR